LIYNDSLYPIYNKKKAAKENQEIKQISGCYLTVFPFISGLSFGCHIAINVVKKEFGMDNTPETFILICDCSYLLILLLSALWLCFDISRLNQAETIELLQDIREDGKERNDLLIEGNEYLENNQIQNDYDRVSELFYTESRG